MEQFRLQKLSNGMRLLHRFDSSPIVYCGFVINAGTRDELPHQYGIAHFIEHLLFKGTRKRTNLQIINRLEEVGGEINAYTTKEETFVYAIVSRKYLDRAVELLTDILFCSSFLSSQLSKEREVVCEEIDMYKDTPTELIFDDFEDLVFQDSELGHNILGSKQSLAKITSQHCLDFVKRCYTTDSMLFFVQGNVGEDTINRITDKYLSHLVTEKRNHQREKPSLYFPQTVSVRKDTSQIHCMIGRQTISFANEDVATLTLLTNIIGGNSLNSRLNLAIRERNGWGYAIDSSLNLYSDIGVWSIYFGCSDENFNKCVARIYKELEKLRHKPLSDYQLTKYKQQMLGQMMISAEGKENYLLATAKKVLHIDQVPDMDYSCDKIKNITSEGLWRVACDLFDIEQFTTLKYY